MVDLFGFAFNLSNFSVGALVGAGVAILTFIIASKLASRYNKKKGQNFAQVKEKLMTAYNGNKVSAEIISELYGLFNTVENEVKKS